MEKDGLPALVRSIVSMSGLKQKYVDMLCSEDSMRIYRQAFTHSTVDPVNNYEWLEILGDATLNKIIVWYISRRFPILQNADGVKVIARLKINMVSKKKFAEIAHILGLEPHIRFDMSAAATNNNRNNHHLFKRSISEDVLEAFFGATELLIDSLVEPGSGHGVCYLIMSKILDGMDISLEYTDLYDPITRLKETFDMHRMRLPGRIEYEPCRQTTSEKGDTIMSTRVWHNGPNQQSVCMGSGTALTPDEAKQAAATEAIEFLKTRGFVKSTPSYYLKIKEAMKAYGDKSAMGALRSI